MTLPKLTESVIRAGATPQSFQRGQEYYQNGAISNTFRQGHVIIGDCEGTSEPYYHLRVTLDEAGVREATCTCPYEYGGYCKHSVALLLTYLHHPKRFAVRQEPAELLADLSHEDLATLVTKLIHDRPELYDWIEAALAVPISPGKTSKKKRKRVDVEVYRRQILGIMHSLQSMRMSEAYWHVGGLVSQLRDVQATATKFLDAGEAETALTILLTLLEESSRGIEYLDDSNGELGGFVGELGQPLAEAILSLDLSVLERKKLADKLTQLVNYASEYGMEGNLDIAIQAAQSGWNTPSPDAGARRPADHESEADDEWIDEVEDYEWDDDESYGDQGWGWPIVSAFGDLTEAKLNVLDRQGRAEDYLVLCQQAGRHLRYALKLCDLKRVTEAVKYAKKHLQMADEAQQMAKRLHEMRHVSEALEVGECGLKLQRPKASLGAWLGPVEEAQGRIQQALAAWLAAFPEEPSLETYKTLKRLGASRWKKLRLEVMQKLRKSHDKQALAEVLLFEEEWDEAIKVAEGRDVWYPIIETVADGVLSDRPEWVAQISLKHAERLMAEAKSKNYPLAAEWLKRAKKAYSQLGQSREWATYLRETKEKYSRRPSLQAQLQQL